MSSTAMPSKPRFYKQETNYSCVVACLRMVLSGYGIEMSEAELRERCDCTPDGTTALNAMDAARDLGLKGSRKYNLELDQLIAEVQTGAYPIVWVNLLPIDGVKEPHAFVVTSVDENSVSILDPLRGERNLPTAEFIAAWKMSRNLALLVLAEEEET